MSGVCSLNFTQLCNDVIQYQCEVHAFGQMEALNLKGTELSPLSSDLQSLALKSSMDGGSSGIDRSCLQSVISRNIIFESCLILAGNVSSLVSHGSNDSNDGK